jgi:hypothetical protein
MRRFEHCRAASAARTATLWLRLCLLCLALALLCHGQTAEVTEEAVHFSGSGASMEVFVDAEGDLPPLSGETEKTSSGLIFRPRYPFRPGVRYRAVIRSADGGEPNVVPFSIEQKAQPSTRLVAIYPSSETLPENQLRFYLQFSAPMSRGEAYKRIRLLDENGKQVELPFLELEQELWDPQGRWLTLLFDPGRVKRGLVPNMEEGEPILEGRSYRMVVDQEWPDAQGLALIEGGEKRFVAGPSDHETPKPEEWRLLLPDAGSRDPLIVEFGEPLDRRLAERLISAMTTQRRVVNGRVTVDRHETRWSLTPSEPWKAGAYMLQVEGVLEDLAGNSVGRPFETVPGREQAAPPPEVVFRKFQIE